jgi:CheY-like chemotaxis protein
MSRNANVHTNAKTILVVDDEPVLRAIVREILHEEGYVVIEAADGRVMLEIMARERLDLVLMDVMMPGIDGREAYRQLRSHPEHRDVPVVMMSAAVKPHGLDPSIAGFMAKPFDISELVDLVASLIGRPHTNGCA